MSHLVKYVVFFFLGLPLLVYGQSSILVPYQKDGKWGYSNMKGRIVVKPNYDNVSSFGGDGKRYIVGLNGKSKLLDVHGKPISKAYDRIFFLKQCIGFKTMVNRKVGILDYEGNEVLPNEYFYIQENSTDSCLLYYGKKNVSGKFSLLTNTVIEETRGEEIEEDVEVDFDADFDGDNEGRLIRTDTTYFTIELNKAQKIGRKIEVRTLKNRAKVGAKTTIDTLDMDFDQVFPLNLNKIKGAIVSNKSRQGLILGDSVVLGIAYDSISPLVINNNCEVFYFKVKKDKKWGVVNMLDKVQIPPNYDQILDKEIWCYDVSNGIAVKNGKKVGLVSLHNEVLLSIKQDSLSYDPRKRYYTYYRHKKKGVFEKNYKTKPVFKLNEELGAITKIYGNYFIKILGNKVNAKNMGSKNILLGYANRKGFRFFNEN